jgi:photosystem II Psb27 protein
MILDFSNLTLHHILQIMFKRLWSQLFALVLVLVVGLVGCAASPGGLVGNYREDTLTVMNSMKAVLALPDDSPDKAAAQSLARLNINDFSSRYRQDPALTKLSSFTSMRTALNSLAAHYAAYPNRPLPEKLRTSLEQKFKQIESALQRGT